MYCLGKRPSRIYDLPYLLYVSPGCESQFGTQEFLERPSELQNASNSLDTWGLYPISASNWLCDFGPTILLLCTLFPYLWNETLCSFRFSSSSCDLSFKAGVVTCYYKTGVKRWRFVDKMKVPGARILTWPWLANSLHMCGQYFAIDSIE